jgi:hypothetical protein
VIRTEFDDVGVVVSVVRDISLLAFDVDYEKLEVSPLVDVGGRRCKVLKKRDFRDRFVRTVGPRPLERRLFLNFVLLLEIREVRYRLVVLVLFHQVF